MNLARFLEKSDDDLTGPPTCQRACMMTVLVVAMDIGLDVLHTRLRLMEEIMTYSIWPQQRDVFALFTLLACDYQVPC